MLRFSKKKQTSTFIYVEHMNLNTSQSLQSTGFELLLVVGEPYPNVGDSMTLTPATCINREDFRMLCTAI